MELDRIAVAKWQDAACSIENVKQGSYSMGAICLSILCLPRQIRFKEQNTILVGLIPGPGPYEA